MAAHSWMGYSWQALRGAQWSVNCGDCLASHTETEVRFHLILKTETPIKYHERCPPASVSFGMPYKVLQLSQVKQGCSSAP